MVYISMLSEHNKYARTLKTMEKNDVLILLYPAGEDSISLSIVNAIKESKGKVIFEKIEPLRTLSVETAIAYRLGLLQAKYNDMRVISDSKVLLEILGIKKVPQKTSEVKDATKPVPPSPAAPKRVGRPKKEVKKPVKPVVPDIKGVEPFPETSKLPKPDMESVDTLKKPEPTAKKAKKPSPAAKKGTIEYEIDQLKALCSSVKTKTFNPADYISTVSKTVEHSIAEGISFADSAKIYFATDKMAKAVIDAFKGKEKELYEIVERIKKLDN